MRWWLLSKTVYSVGIMATENTTPQPAQPTPTPDPAAAAPPAPPEAPAPAETPTGERKVITPPIDMLAERMRVRVNQGFLKSNLSSVDRNSVNHLAGTLALQSDEKDKASARLEYLLCFLDGDIDWKKRYKEVFGLEPPKERRSVIIPESVRKRGKISSAKGVIEEPDY